MRKIKGLIVLAAVFGIFGCQAAKQITAPVSNPPPPQVPVTISASSMYGAADLFVDIYTPGSTVVGCVTITGIPTAPAATVTAMSFDAAATVVFLLEQLPFTCASNPGYTAGVSLVVSDAGCTGFSSYPGTQIQACGTAGVEQTMAMFTENNGTFVRNY